MTMERLIIKYKNGTTEERIIYPFHKSKTFKELGFCQKGMTTEVACITVTKA
jgi:hypothetical protein